MIYTLRHLALRIWVSIFIGGLLNLWILPAFHEHIGLDLLIVPASGVFIAIFIVFGWLSNRIGLAIVDRWIKDATAWERVGLHRRAEEGFRKAVAVLDSFLLSPLARGKISDRLTNHLARFYLARAEKNHISEALITSYIRAHPEDAESAETWLQQIESKGGFSEEHHELALRVGDAQQDNAGIQHMLARFYLSAGRTDFPALQTYRRVLNGEGGAGDEITEDLANLFLAEGRADEWALSVYLRAYTVSRGKSHFLKGIAACIYWIQETERTRKLIKEAQSLLDDFDEEALAAMRAGFNPPSLQPPEQEVSHTFRAAVIIWRAVRRTGQSLYRLIKVVIPHVHTRCRNLVTLIKSSVKLHRALEWSIMAILAIGVVILVINTIGHLISTKWALTDSDKAARSLVTDPFTLQVAAYLKPQDAQRYVEHLNKLGLDAYLMRRAGKRKTWYQVRVSYFADKASARAYGKSLKDRGIIDDFYVANYERP